MRFQLQKEHWLLALVALAVLARLIPHPPNITPIGALALFSGACLPRRFWLISISALLLSDWLLGWYDIRLMVFVYLGFVASIGVGRSLLWQGFRWRTLPIGVGVAALIFWCISNLGVWLTAYPMTWAGFLECYLVALPFLGLSLVGDAIYTLLLFGGYQLLSRRFMQNVQAL